MYGVLLTVLLSGSFLMFLGHRLVKLAVLLGGAGQHLAVLFNFATAVLGGFVALRNDVLMLFNHALTM